MKRVKAYLLIAGVLLLAVAGKTQLTGTKNIPGDYVSLAAAITDLNAQGVGAGGVTLNLVASNPQTAPAGGYGIVATGTVANPVTLTGNSNTITASAALNAGDLNDAIFKIIGGDYITIQGFTMQENAANTTSAAATNNMTEWGIAVLYASATDGAKNVTIQNNAISLDRTYANTFGIYSTNLHSATDVVTPADITAASGANDNLHIYGNTISNVNNGICVVGSLTDAFMATGLDIGGSAAGTANTLSDYGTTGTFSAYVSVDPSVSGIYVNNNINVNISHNNVTSSAGGTVSGKLHGIFLDVTGALPVPGSITNAINNNSISVNSASGTDSIIGITNNPGNPVTSYTINNNDFNNSGHTVAASEAVVFIFSPSPALNVTINNNTFTNLSVNTTGDAKLIDKSPAAHPSNAVININNNSVITGFTKTGIGGFVYGYVSGGSPASGTENNNGNNFSNITVSGSTQIRVWDSEDGTPPSGTIKSVSNNTFTNITGGTGTVRIIHINGGNAGDFNPVSNNIINTISGGGTVTGISFVNGTFDVFGNDIHSVSVTGAGALSGINPQGGVTLNIYKNKIYDLTSTNAAGAVNGILLNGTAATTSNIYNNLIADLKTPITSAANNLRGVNINVGTANTTINLSFNTIYLNATSTGTNFGSTGVFHAFNTTATSSTLNMRDNIIVNSSTPNGTGVTAAFRRSSATNLNNFGTADNNLFYAGAPGATRLIFTDGTNPKQTLADYQAWVSPRETNSVTESPAFLSTVGSSPDFLHIDPLVPSQIESKGIPVAGITDDFDGNTRNSSTPDIGADEFNGTFPLPVSLLSFSGFKNGSKNSLRWVTASEFNNRGFEVQRSADGIEYSQVGFVNTQAPYGTSSSDLVYTFDDNNPADKKQYYRLRQVDIDGHAKLSNTIAINASKPQALVIESLFPNPARNIVNVSIAAPQNDNVTIVIMDLTGKIIKQEQVKVGVGSNTMTVGIAELATGSYIIRAISRSQAGVTATGKFNKQ